MIRDTEGPIIHVSAKDFAALQAAIDNPAEPTEKLKQLMKGRAMTQDTEDVVRLAEVIHDAMVWAAQQAGPPQRWQNGNSFAEGRARQAARTALEMANQSLSDRIDVQVEAAYREGWHEGYATGDAGGSYTAVELDWLGSDVRAALHQEGIDATE